jgi:hypothetical protein
MSPRKARRSRSTPTVARSRRLARAVRRLARSARRLARAVRRRPLVAVFAIGLIALAVQSARSAWEPSSWRRVLATREGDIGRQTATGEIIRPESRFVALPHRRALGRRVEVRYRGISVVVPVLDVGPWNIDDAYWETDARPASESGRGAYRVPVNTAGIDLSDAVFAALGLRDNDVVEWRFVHRGWDVLPRLAWDAAGDRR